jgi:dihydrofolate synthase / folylpolyglutamate synthase
MNYQQTLDYLYSRLPMFSKLGASAIKKDLHNTIELCKRLDNPQEKFRTIHIAGTNGKGSVSHMLAAILQTAGYKTGLYTSPHLRDFRERIRINGEMISQEEVIAFTESQKDVIEEIEPSFFEVTVAMAFSYFSREQVDIAVIETGLGGRLDSTNIITPLLSVITNIGLDHTNILGDTLPQIAFEKAGIIKPSVPLVIGERHPDTETVFVEKAIECKSKITFAEDIWKVKTLLENTDEKLAISAREQTGRTLDLDLDLTATYQLKNVKTVLTAVDQLRGIGFKITENDVYNALSQVKSLTGFAGRWQTIGRSPLIICDTGHNGHGITEVVKNIANTSYDRLHVVLGMVRDKDITKVLSLLPTEATYYFCAPDVERAKPAIELRNEAEKLGLIGSDYLSVAEALKSAKIAAGEKDLIFVGGSTFVVAEVV